MNKVGKAQLPQCWQWMMPGFGSRRLSLGHGLFACEACAVKSCTEGNTVLTNTGLGWCGGQAGSCMSWAWPAGEFCLSLVLEINDVSLIPMGSAVSSSSSWLPSASCVSVLVSLARRFWRICAPAGNLLPGL